MDPTQENPALPDQGPPLASDAAHTPGPLSGLRVVEMGQLIAGPFCGQLLGDMGAEVLKIEPPGRGDPMREWGYGKLPLWWEVIARNKKSITLNLRLEQGQQLARDLIAKTDILIENFRPGTLEEWNLSPAALCEVNSRLIVVRISGYGQTGPYAKRTGFGGVGEAMGGLRHIVGDPDRTPSRIGIALGDSLCATFGCLGALAALNHRHVTGRGQIVDAAIYESVLQVMESLIPEYAASGFIRERSGSILPGIAPSNVYRCLDGQILIGANQDTVFRRLCAAMRRPELAVDDRFSSHTLRGRHQRELDQLIESWTMTKTVAELDELMEQFSVPAGRIYRAPEMLQDPHFAARNAIVEVPHPRFGTVKMQGVFPKLSLTPGSVRSPAPVAVGEHTRSILRDLLGITDPDFLRLQEGGVV
jgi:crotonobetainyl-CoA:carnitine CoA-transferase CaiB-like acyl-CoA transferase